LIKKVYEVEPLQCPACGGTMKIVSFIEKCQPGVLEKSFHHCGLWEEAVSTQHSELIALYKEMSQLRSSDDPIDFQIDNNLPIMNLTLEKNSKRASFFSTITTLGTPLDLTTQELRIELFFPSDEETKLLFSLEI